MNDVSGAVSTNKARGGVTGHHVRYVLAFGLAGSIIAFAVIGLYFGYGLLTQMISQMSTQINPTTLVSYAIMIALAVVATVLLLGLWDMVSGTRPEHQPEGDALAGRAAIHRHLPRHGRPLFVRQVLAAYVAVETRGAQRGCSDRTGLCSRPRPRALAL